MFTTFSVPLTTQETEDNCTALVVGALAAVDDACSGLGRNQVCYGHNLVAITNFDDEPLEAFTNTGDILDQFFSDFLKMFIGCTRAKMVHGQTFILRIRSLKTDTGMGIPFDGLEKIFDPFFSSKEEGTGMGLAVAYRIVKEHGGEINVESEVGKGTEFRIWLPIKPELSV